MGIAKSKRNIIKIAAMTSVCVFSLFALFGGTVAWFSANQALVNDSDDFPVARSNGKLSSVTFHEVEEVLREDRTGDAISFSFDPSPCGTITYNWSSDSASVSFVAEGKTSVSLNTYDPLRREQPLLLVFHLDKAYSLGEGSIKIDAKADALGFLGEKKSDSAEPKYSLSDEGVIYKSVNSTNYYWLSSIVQFYTLGFANDDIGFEFALQESYAEEHSLPLISLSEERFASADNDGDTCSFDPSVELFSSSSGVAVKNIGVIVDYYPDAIEYIYSTYLGNTILEDDYEGFLHFWCDWKMEVY